MLSYNIRRETFTNTTFSKPFQAWTFSSDYRYGAVKVTTNDKSEKSGQIQIFDLQNGTTSETSFDHMPYWVPGTHTLVGVKNDTDQTFLIRVDAEAGTSSTRLSVAGQMKLAGLSSSGRYAAFHRKLHFPNQYRLVDVRRNRSAVISTPGLSLFNRGMDPVIWQMGASNISPGGGYVILPYSTYFHEKRLRTKLVDFRTYFSGGTDE